MVKITYFDRLAPNLALEGKLTMTPELLEFKNKLDIALGKLPNEARTVYRGVGAKENADLDSWVEGGMKTFNKFLSTSINPNEAEKFRIFEKGKYFLEIKSKTGKNIAALSSLPEEEILFKTGTIFDIVSIEPDEKDASRIIIKLIEQ